MFHCFVNNLGVPIKDPLDRPDVVKAIEDTRNLRNDQAIEKLKSSVIQKKKRKIAIL